MYENSIARPLRFVAAKCRLEPQICGAQLTLNTVGQAVAALRDASVEGAYSVRIGVVGVAGLFGLATHVLPRRQGASRCVDVPQQLLTPQCLPHT